MKAKQVVFLFIVILLSITSESYTQQRVINIPRRTVVQRPRRTVVYKKKQVVRSAPGDFTEMLW